MKYNELDFQKEIASILITMGYNEITIPDEGCKDAAFFESSLRKYLNSRYKIDSQEISEVLSEINKKINRLSWYLNNKAAFLDILKNGILTKKLKEKNQEPYKLIDLSNMKNNIYEVSQEVWLTKGSRADLVVFVNGLPIYVLELKSTLREEATLNDAFNQIKEYLTFDNQSFATFNIAQIVAKNFNFAKIGSVGSKSLETWFSLKPSNGSTKDFFDVFSQSAIIDYIKWGALFTQKGEGKYILKHHQRVAVKNTLANLKGGLGGYIWHTQGSGKTITISALISAMTRTDGLSSFTSIIDVDRQDLADNILSTVLSLDSNHFDGQDIRKSHSKADLQKYLSTRNHRGVLVTTTQKFDSWGEISSRKDILLISDEAHRSHKEDYSSDESKTYLEKIKEALPNAIKIGFTGTPIFDTDKSTFAMFGNCIHKYTMKQAEADGVVVPIRCSFIKIPLEVSMGKYDLHQKYGNIVKAARLIDESTARLEYISDEIREVFTQQKMQHNSLVASSNDKYKAMVVTNSKAEGFQMYKLLLSKVFFGDEEKIKFVASLDPNAPEKDRKSFEIHKFLKANESSKAANIEEFKKQNSKIEIMIVVDMLITGYDVPNLRLLFLDKKIKMHNLLQTISRVNRKFVNKNEGYVISFRDIKDEMSKALKAYSETTNDHDLIIRISGNAEQEIFNLISKIKLNWGVDIINLSASNVCFEANLIKEKFEKNDLFFSEISTIVSLASVVVKWNDKHLARVALMCKLILQTKRMETPSFIDITDDEFEMLLNSIAVNRELVRKVDFSTLEDILKASMPQQNSVDLIGIKIAQLIKRDKTLLKSERETLLEQLKKIIDSYNGNNFDSFASQIRQFEDNLFFSNGNYSDLTKLLIRTVKEMVNEDLSSKTKSDIDLFFNNNKYAIISRDTTPGDQKRLKADLKKIIENDEPKLATNAAKIVSKSWEKIAE